jgi:hypothetical protein
VVFPETIGEYKRVSVTEFNSRNHGVGYALDRDGKRLNTVTLFAYVMAGNPTCQQEFDDSAASIMRANPAAVRISTGTAASPRGRTDAALHSRYVYTANYAGTTMPIASDLYVYCKPGTEWMVKARSSGPASTDMSQDTAMILRAVTWPSEIAD